MFFWWKNACKINNVGLGVVKVHVIEMMQQKLGLTCNRLLWLFFDRIQFTILVSFLYV